MSNGDTVVTEINGDWIDVLRPDGSPVTDTNPPGFSYPSDTNEVRPGVFLSVDYTNPGAIETFTTTGRLLWRYEPRRRCARSALARAAATQRGCARQRRQERSRDRVDPHTNRIVWQYGHTHQPVRGRVIWPTPTAWISRRRTP